LCGHELSRSARASQHFIDESRYFADQLKTSLEDRQEELAENEQLEAVAGLLSGKAGGIAAIDYNHPSLITV
jgi:predicted house-cleaning noncanonical NTP pyrophosphatase (MazG superfamily)